MCLVSKHQNLLNEEKALFQDLIDHLYEKLIVLFGEEGITNCIHILGYTAVVKGKENHTNLYFA
jgi:hypothetical protein